VSETVPVRIFDPKDPHDRATIFYAGRLNTLLNRRDHFQRRLDEEGPQNLYTGVDEQGNLMKLEFGRQAMLGLGMSVFGTIEMMKKLGEEETMKDIMLEHTRSFLRGEI
jgi:hypothetical protein